MEEQRRDEERVGLKQQGVIDDGFWDYADLGEDEDPEHRNQKAGDTRLRPDRDQLTERDEGEDDSGSVDSFHGVPFELGV
ncbi:hypothetical protein GCM10010974_25590 [Brevibacterium sediminis]|uniref:Uncharacterized protein n=1 Tax=Brevibacterium sediminis TaxID=1857024 RepID=A0ABQ1MK01_9MICO|nr:hypothetical protein GCM10010974_25590 [Brevibacterium sediminis]